MDYIWHIVSVVQVGPIQLINQNFIGFDARAVTPQLELIYEPDDEDDVYGKRYEGFTLYEARLRQISPYGEVEIVANRVTFNGLRNDRGKVIYSGIEQSLEDSLDPGVRTLTIEELQDAEWKTLICGPPVLPELKRTGDFYKTWNVRLLREHNYDSYLTSLGIDTSYIKLRRIDPSCRDPKRRLFSIEGDIPATKEIWALVERWLAMEDYSGHYNDSELPEPRAEWLPFPPPPPSPPPHPSPPLHVKGELGRRIKNLLLRLIN